MHPQNLDSCTLVAQCMDVSKQRFRETATFERPSCGAVWRTSTLSGLAQILRRTVQRIVGFREDARNSDVRERADLLRVCNRTTIIEAEDPQQARLRARELEQRFHVIFIGVERA